VRKRRWWFGEEVGPLPPLHSLHFAKGDATQHLLVLKETEDKN
jgi:hypothetical protein